MFDDGSNPADALTTPQVGRPTFFDVALLNDMPKGPFPILVLGLSPQADSAPPQEGLRIYEIRLENGIDRR